jgi:hypothetical protein
MRTARCVANPQMLNMDSEEVERMLDVVASEGEKKGLSLKAGMRQRIITTLKKEGLRRGETREPRAPHAVGLI